MNTIQILQLAVAADPGLGEIRDKHRSAAKELLPRSEPDQHPAHYPAQYGAQYGAQPLLRGVEIDERAGDKGR